MRAGLALVLAVVLAGCAGSGGDERGTAWLWITRDRGETVLYEGEVAAGQTALQALRSRAHVETAYGGRFVRAIDGLEGSPAAGRDWFYFVNGVAAERGAAEYRVRDGEVVWWDFHRWVGRPEAKLVVGAFPEPLVSGYDGRLRETVVRYERPEQRPAAEAIGRLLGSRSVAQIGVPVPGPGGANVFFLAAETQERFQAEADSPTGPYYFTFSGDALALARDPGRYRFRFEVP